MPRKGVPPSRLRYEAKNPSITFRVNQKQFEKLQEMCEKTRLSVGKLVRRMLGLEARSTKEAYEKGYRDGEGTFTVPCCKCGRMMRFDIKSPKQEEAKQELLRAFSRWAHTTCPGDEG